MADHVFSPSIPGGDFEKIQTKRLTLVPLTPGLARMALQDREGMEKALGARVPVSWPGADFASMLPRISTFREATFTWLVIHDRDRTLIGESGFHGQPDETGNVEIGYSIVPEYRGMGFASEAARAVIEASFTSPNVRRVVAECLEDNAPSLRVLEKLGMRRVGRAGETINFELRRA